MIIRFLILFALCAGLFPRPISAAATAKFDLKPFAEGFVSPTALVQMPNGGEFLVADQAGTVHLVSRDGKRAESPFLDLRPRLTKLNPSFDERGLLGLALHPKFSENKKFYVTYSAPRRESAPPDWDHTMRLSEFTANADGKSAKGSSE